MLRKPPVKEVQASGGIMMSIGVGVAAACAVVGRAVKGTSTIGAVIDAYGRRNLR